VHKLVSREVAALDPYKFMALIRQPADDPKAVPNLGHILVAGHKATVSR
jgi:hypothetical protein